MTAGTEGKGLKNALKQVEIASHIGANNLLVLVEVEPNVAATVKQSEGGIRSGKVGQIDARLR